MSTLEVFPWNSSFDTGIELIDEQHKELVNIINMLAVSIANRSSNVVIYEQLTELEKYADYHFKTEDSIWLEYFKNDKWYTDHHSKHDSLIDELAKLKKSIDKESLSSELEYIIKFLTHWLAFHILESDKQMALAVNAIQLGSSLEDAKYKSTCEMDSTMKFFVDTLLPMHDNISTRTMEVMSEKALRKETEELLNNTEERWKFILEGIEESVWDWNIKDDKMYLSEKNISLFEIIDKDNNKNMKNSTIHPNDIKQVKADLQAHLDGKTEFYVNKHRVIREDGSWAWVLSRGKVVSRDENAKPLRMVGNHSDITERELASTVYKNISQAILICDVNKKIIAINPSFTDITGYDEKDAIGKNPSFMASGKHNKKFYQNMWNKIMTDGYFHGKIYNKRKNGEIFLESMELRLITDSNGQTDHYVALFNDITEITEIKKEREKQNKFIFQQSRMAQMGEMISMIAHQWRQPLGAISSTCIDLTMQMEFEKFDLKEERGREECKAYFSNALKEINGFVQSLTNTIDDFRNFYKPNREADYVFIGEPVSRALNIMRASFASDGIEIVETYAENKKLVKMYSNEIMQVVLNIFKNSHDNFKEKDISEPKIVVECGYSDSDIAIINIYDNGGGIPEDVIEKIFDPYFSTKDEKNGTGLGLYMSKTIVEDHHNGELQVTNRDDGVCFTIWLYDGDSSKQLMGTV